MVAARLLPKILASPKKLFSIKKEGNVLSFSDSSLAEGFKSRHCSWSSPLPAQLFWQVRLEACRLAFARLSNRLLQGPRDKPRDHEIRGRIPRLRSYRFAHSLSFSIAFLDVSSLSGHCQSEKFEPGQPRSAHP
jgi:hypothetical protein